MDPTAGTRLKSLRLCRACVLAFVLCTGCASPTSPRDAYIRATLPYDAALLVRSATRMRRDHPDSKEVVLLDQTILEHLLRLHICLLDPEIPDSHKSYARDVMPLVAAYAREHRIADAFQAGREYDMLPEDLVLPRRLAIRDLFEQIMEHQKP
jgi:hypothetical protein